MEIVKVKKVHEDALIPTKAYASDAGFDLHALEDVFITPGETVKIRTGLSFDLPSGYEMQIRPRSGMSLLTKIRVAFGTVDSDYRGEVAIIADNVGEIPFEVSKGDRVAQAVIQQIPHITLVEVIKLSNGARGGNGFGSTGINHEY